MEYHRQFLISYYKGFGIWMVEFWQLVFALWQDISKIRQFLNFHPDAFSVSYSGIH